MYSSTELQIRIEIVDKLFNNGFCKKKNIFQQPLFKQICNTLNEYGYDVYDISKNDFYPLTARDIRIYHTLPDSLSLNSVAINGIIFLKCKNVNIRKGARNDDSCS